MQNSTGQPGSLHIVGSRVAQENALTLFAQDLPPNTFGMFINGTGSNVTPLAGDTYYFQAWYRDPAVLSTNFTNAVQIDLQ